MSINIFSNREIVIATKHKKEVAIAPILEESLGLKCVVPENFDTDKLGTFTGEIERESDPITTARNKCILAMDQFGFDLGIASEGSFGAHPSLFFANADEEYLILIDRKNDLEIIAKHISSETNFNGREVATEKELIEFAKKAQFPGHALILRRSKFDFNSVSKGINNETELIAKFKDLMEKYEEAYVETDMRAMFNPNRMEVIRKTAVKLVEKINSHCPKCNTPGFGVTDIKQGLPCGLCGMPTKSTLSHIYSCQKCAHSKQVMFPNKKESEDPTFCDFCNP